MKKIARILRALEKSVREMLNLQKEYNKCGLYIEKSELTGRNIEYTKNDYFPEKMRKYVEHGHGYYSPWHWFADYFYNVYNQLNSREQSILINNIHKYRHLFAAIKSGYSYNFPMIYEEWGYDPILEENYWELGVFDEEEYAKDYAKDKERYLYYANIKLKLKENINVLEDTIRNGSWACACPGHHKISRMKHNPW